VIDLENGDVARRLRIEGQVEELYDVVALEGVTHPTALGFRTDEIRDNVWFPREDGTSRWTLEKRVNERTD
jgi:hypothetical protein